MKSRSKTCPVCEASARVLDYKDERTLSRFLTDRFRHLAICVGRGCLRACLDHLEKTGRIAAAFKTPLIERARWKLDEPPPRPPTGNANA